jgi:hypothetical protein
MALGHNAKAQQFEDLLAQDANHAFSWLELCRLFLIGPVHYSLGGIHSTSHGRVEAIRKELPEDVLVSPESQALQFPTDLGVVLVKTLDLFRPPPDIRHFSLEDCLASYHDFELARRTLLQLNENVQKGELPSIERVDDLKDIMRKYRRKERMWMASFRIIAATAVSVAAHAAGLLAELGFNVALESASDLTNKAAQLAQHALEKAAGTPNLTLLFQLEDEVKRNYTG